MNDNKKQTLIIPNLVQNFINWGIKLYQENKGEIAAIGGLFLIFLLLAPLIIGHQGHPIIDSGRLAYVPSEMLRGKVLYKDIIEIMAPLSFQLNALFYKLFGENLNTLYTVGLVNSFIAIVSLFFIAKTITSNRISWGIAFVVTTVCVFNCYIFNFVFPYTSSMPYALSAFLLSLLFCIYYFKTSKPLFGLLSFFFIGVSLTSKYEYLLYFMFMTTCIALFKPLSKKDSLRSAGLFFLTPVISLSVLFLQGLRPVHILNTIKLIKEFSSLATLKYFYANFIGIYFNPQSFAINMTNFFNTTFYFAVSATLLYLLIGLVLNKYRHLLKRKIPNYAQPVLITVALIFFPWSLINNFAQDAGFTWLPISTSLIFIGFIFNYVLKMIKSREFNLKEIKTAISQKIGTEEGIFIFITITALTSVIKSYFFLHLHVYGTFMFPLVFMVNIAFIVNYLPKKFKFLDANLFQLACLIILVAIGGTFMDRNTTLAMNALNYPIKTEKGTLYTSKDMAVPLNQVITYVQKNIPQGSTFLMLPEGPMLNFLTDRRLNNKYYTLLPTDLELETEDTIIKNLNKKLPDYIFINNRDSGDYGFMYFGRDYGQGVYNFIQQNYELKVLYGDKFNTNGFKVAIFKKKLENVSKK